MMSKALFYIAIAAAVILMILPFLPWVEMQSASLVLDGIHDKKFPNGTSYGKPGYVIIFLSAMFLILHFMQSRKAKMLNLLFTGLLVAYCLRSFYLYTTSLFDNEIVKYPAVWGILILPFIVLLAAIFPFKENRR